MTWLFFKRKKNQFLSQNEFCFLSQRKFNCEITLLDYSFRQISKQASKYTRMRGGGDNASSFCTLKLSFEFQTICSLFKNCAMKMNSVRTVQCDVDKQTTTTAKKTQFYAFIRLMFSFRFLALRYLIQFDFCYIYFIQITWAYIS